MRVTILFLLWTAWAGAQTAPPVCGQRFAQQISVRAFDSSYRIAASQPPGRFRSGQLPDIVLSAFGFNVSGGPLQFRYNSGITTAGSRLLLADRGNNRVLIWNELPTANTPPDLVLGQPDFDTNQSGPGRHEMDWPLSVATDGRRIVVADAYNDRLLVWNDFPEANGTPADFEIPVNWPWGVWTNGEKLVATTTINGAALIWNTFPTRGDQPPDLRLRAGGMMGTPRTITSDGKSLIIGDHNSRVTSVGQGNFVWKQFPTVDDAPYDYFFTDPRDQAVAWLQGKFLTDGRLVMLGGMLHLWNTLPGDAGTRPELSLSAFPFHGGDGSDVATADGRLFVSGANGNRILVYNSIPNTPDALPDFALGSPDICTNTLESNFIITNPAPASNGQSLFVSSDFDRKLYVWQRLPDDSAAAPDFIYSLPDAPWQNALHDNTLVLAGGRAITIWNALPVDGRMPSAIIRDRIGNLQLREIRGVAYNGRYFALSDLQAEMVYVWEGLPRADSQPKFQFPVQRPGRLSLDDNWLIVTPFDGPSLQVYLLDQLGANAQPQRIGGPQVFNLPQHALLAAGQLFVADTVFNRIHVWNSVDDALRGRPADAVLGSADRKPSNRRDGLFWPGALSFDGSYLWSGEYKFSGRIVRFTVQ